MPKQLRNYPIYIAPHIRGILDNTGEPVVYDEKTNQNLNIRSINDKILVYERQVKGWFLDRATGLLKGDKSGFIILMISISYIEGVEQYRRGNYSRRASKEFFTDGLRRIFDLDNIHINSLHDFYTQVRCGLFHTGMTQNKVIISREYRDPIDFTEPDTIKINPQKFLGKIKQDFNGYLIELRNPQNERLRNNFNRMFSNI